MLETVGIEECSAVCVHVQLGNSGSQAPKDTVRKGGWRTSFSSFLWKMFNGLDVNPALKCYWHKIPQVIQLSFAKATWKLKLFSRLCFFFNFGNGKLNDPSAPHDSGNKMLIQNSNVKITWILNHRFLLSWSVPTLVKPFFFFWEGSETDIEPS